MSVQRYYCSSCDKIFTAVVLNMYQTVFCPFCNSRHRNDLPIRKRIYFSNSVAGFLVFKDKAEQVEYRRHKINLRNIAFHKKRRGKELIKSV